MKNLIRVYSVSVVTFVFPLFLLFPVNSYAQKKTQQETLAAFPESISGIFNNSCIACHSDQSNSKAKIFMNLSEWDKLNPKKQLKTAKKINKKVSKGKMPPSGFLEKHPSAALTTIQIESIASWSNSLKK